MPSRVRVTRQLQRWLLAAMLMGALPGAWATIRVVDDRGEAVSLPAPAQRVVSLLPSLTETVCALGACERLVGVDRYSNWPQAVQSLPKVGGGLDPNVEAVLALRPDVVLIAGSSRAVSRLQSLGLRLLVLEPKTHADARRVFQLLGQVLGVQQADRLWGRIDTAVELAAHELPLEARGWRVYFEVNRGPYAAAPGSFVGETLSRLGLGNVVSDGQGPFPQINPEWVLRSAPDLVLLGERGDTAPTERPGWSGLRAVQQGRVCLFTPEQADVLVRPGPRMDEAARLVVACVRGAPGVRRLRPGAGR